PRPLRWLRASPSGSARPRPRRRAVLCVHRRRLRASLSRSGPTARLRELPDPLHRNVEAEGSIFNTAKAVSLIEADGGFILGVNQHGHCSNLAGNAETALERID